MKKMLAVILLLCTVWVSCCGMYNVSNRFSAGDLVTFGTYEQDNNLRNGKESIESIVLDVQGRGAVSGHEVYNSGYDGSVGGVRPAIWVHTS